MPKPILLPLTALALVVCCFSGSALAGPLVPPGNSAANQYTETFPTSKGEEDSQGKKKTGVKPAQVLGADKAHQLEDEGPTGKAVADFAAETSPSAAGSTEAGSDSGKANGKPGKSKGDKNGAGSNGDEEGSEGTGGAGGGKAPSGGSGAAAASSGSSGLGEVASQATGTSSGTLGLWLPLILIAVVIWSAAYVWRNRQQRVV